MVKLLLLSLVLRQFGEIVFSPASVTAGMPWAHRVPSARMVMLLAPVQFTAGRIRQKVAQSAKILNENRCISLSGHLRSRLRVSGPSGVHQPLQPPCRSISCRTSMRILATLHSEGFTTEIVEHDDGTVRFKADADIDADGANGQRGGRPAYTAKNDGSEHLANGGMGIRNGKVVFTTSWGPDIAEADADGNPLVIDGVVITRTAYRYPGETDPRKKWVDSQTVPYVVVPPVVIRAVRGIVKGCQAFAMFNGQRVPAVVADVGPRSKCGEISIALADALGIPSSPRHGGWDEPDIEYEIHPGVPARVNGELFELMPA